MNILFAVAEAVPFAKTGGLADVGGELPKYLVKLGAKVTVIMPKHGQIKQAYAKDFKFEKWFTINILNKEEYVGVFSYKMDGVDYYFIDNETFFKREGLYGYDDDHIRYGYFCIAVVELVKSLELKLNIISLHDWQTSMIAPIIRENHPDHPLFKDAKLLVTIHNPAYQGWCDKDNLWNIFKISMDTYHSGKNRHKDGLSYLKSGLMYADKITTVSPNHVKELMRGEHSFGLEGLLRYRGEDFIGILNGIDYVNYDPTTDKIINQTFNKFDKGKLVNKKFLQQQFKLVVDNNIPLISIVSRLVFQKGIELIIKNIDYMMSRGAQLIVLGSGEYQLEQAFEYYRAKYPDQIGIYMGYNEELARKIYAGSDMFLMPSLFEPCGIGQMIAMRYGTVPIARATGGLYDTITDFDKDNETGDGFLFSDYDEWGLRYALSQGLDAYKSRMKWKKIVTNAMEKDNSWENSAQAYFNFYNQTIIRKK
jgi:starch synthase